MRMKTSIAVHLIFCALAAMPAVGQTNALWKKTFTFPTTNVFNVADVFRVIENESRKLDSHGLTILFPSYLTNRTGKILFDPGESPISFADTLHVCAGVGDTKYRIFDKTAVVGSWCFRYTLLSLSGRCSDADTGEPITNFVLKAVNDLDPEHLMIDKKGQFHCGVPHRFDYMWTPSAVIADHDISYPQGQIFEFSAPGYQPSVVTNSIYWADGWGQRFVEVALKPENKKANNPSHHTTESRAKARLPAAGER